MYHNYNYDATNFAGREMLVFSYIGWILEQVEGDVCVIHWIK